MTVEELNAWLAEKLEQAEENARDSYKAAMGSYVAGFDRGFADALKRVKLKIEDKLDT